MLRLMSVRELGSACVGEVNNMLKYMCVHESRFTFDRV